ncbi:MAG: hypothetical protein ACO3YU_04640 [Candidatus Nanopelagicales bacterium]
MVSIIRRGNAPFPAWLPPALWFASGVISSLTAWFLRLTFVDGRAIDYTNLALNGFFVTLTVGIATVGFASLTDRRRQVLVLAQQREQLIDLRSQAEDRALRRSTELQAAVSAVVAPEIDRLREEISALGMDPDIDRLREVQANLASYSESMVRRISHDMSQSREPINSQPAPILSTWRDSARLAASAQVSAPLTVVAAILLFLPQINLGCVGIPLLAVTAFLAVTVGFGLLGRIQALSRPPLSLAWLLISALLGFTAYRLILNAGPQQCTWVTEGWESALATATAITVFLGLTIVVQSSRQAALMIRDLESTNLEIVEVTRQLNLTGALTQGQISQILHGPIQGRLAAAIMALRIHMDEVLKGESPSSALLQLRITTLLDDAADDLLALGRPASASSADAEDLLVDLGSRWRGFLDIDISLDAGAQGFLGEHADWVPRVIQCVEEALTNASRHGSARHALVELSLDGSIYLVCTVTDDGHGVVEDIGEGIGLTGIITSGGTWQLSPNRPRGARLKVMWPLP